MILGRENQFVHRQLITWSEGVLQLDNPWCNGWLIMAAGPLFDSTHCCYITLGYDMWNWQIPSDVLSVSSD